MQGAQQASFRSSDFSATSGFRTIAVYFGVGEYSRISRVGWASRSATSCDCRHPRVNVWKSRVDGVWRPFRYKSTGFGVEAVTVACDSIKRV